MGLGQSKEARQQAEIDALLESALGGQPTPEWANSDALRSTKDLALALKRSGIESSNLMVAFDFTASNKTAGANSFGGLSLHTLRQPGGNPYEQVAS